MATPSFQSLKSSRRFAPRLVIMVKEPLAGRVKTRLARGIGAVGAVSVYRAMLGSVAARLGADRRWQTVLAVSPDTARVSRMLPHGRLAIPQGQGDLGQRLQAVFAMVPPGPVVVIGTDIPGITPRDIADAFRALGSHDAVFGSSPDGGYWLVGLKRRPRVPRAFGSVRWSSSFALADTEANLHRLKIAHLAVRDDVDDAASLMRLAPLIGRRILPFSGRSA